VIGCGWIMRALYTPAFLSMPQLTRVTAVCDLNESAASAIAKGIPGAAVFTDMDAMLQSGTFDAVLILTSEKFNAAVAQRVLKANVPIYLEKPPANDSAELEELIAAEARSQTFVYAAFNRRHIPLFSHLDFNGERVRRISGSLRRTDRTVAMFPPVTVHLIDSAQHYAQSLFQKWEVRFIQNREDASWTIHGTMDNGAACDLQLVPKGTDFVEFLVLETESGTWELQFPNEHAPVPEGEIIVRRKDGSPATTTRGEKEMPFFESTGFRDCLLDFFRCIETGKDSNLHTLARCRSTIRLMEELKEKTGA
jgi:virulence factor